MTTSRRQKLIILVKHGLYEPWIDIAENGQGPTWLTNASRLNIQIVHFYGIPTKGVPALFDKWHEKLRQLPRFHIALSVIDRILLSPFLLWIPKAKSSSELAVYGDQIKVSIPDTILLLRWKQLSAYRHVLRNYNFDFCYETNVSSYVRIENLIQFVNRLNCDDTYQGNLIGWEKFVSGANRLWSRSVLEKVLANRIHWNPAALEDLAVGRLAKRIDVEARESDSIQLTEESEISTIPEQKMLSTYHFRMKSFRDGKRLDSCLMLKLHNRFEQGLAKTQEMP